MQKQLQSLELLQRQVCMVKVQHQLNRTRTTRFVQTQTRQASNENGTEEKSNEDGSNEKGCQGQASNEAYEEKFFKRFDVLDR